MSGDLPRLTDLMRRRDALKPRFTDARSITAQLLDATLHQILAA